MPRRASAGLTRTDGSSMPESLSRSPGLPGMLLSAYIGWKQPPSSAPSAQIASNRATIDPSSHDIDDSLRDVDHFLRRLPLQRPFYRIERQNGSLNLGVDSCPGDGQIGTLAAVDLHRQRHGVLYQQIAFDLRPFGVGDQRFVAQCGPAFLAQMRHHRMEQADQYFRRLTRREPEIRSRFRTDGRQRGRERIGKLVDVGDADVEAETLDVVGDMRK